MKQLISLTMTTRRLEGRCSLKTSIISKEATQIYFYRCQSPHQIKATQDLVESYELVLIFTSRHPTCLHRWDMHFSSSENKEKARWWENADWKPQIFWSASHKLSKRWKKMHKTMSSINNLCYVFTFKN